MNYSTLLAAFVSISCNTCTQTFTISTKITIACVCMAIFDKGGHINLKYITTSKNVMEFAFLQRTQMIQFTLTNASF